MPTASTQNELYEYRIGLIIQRTLRDLGAKLENLDADQLAQLLWDNEEAFGRRVLRDMGEWMNEEDWLELVKNG